jgi:hypothetical protein
MRRLFARRAQHDEQFDETLSAAWSRRSIAVASPSRPDGFVVNLTRVDRAPPKAPQGDFEQCVKAPDAIDAGLGVQAHGKARQERSWRR